MQTRAFTLSMSMHDCQSRHVDLGEHEFPFSRGCSFYEVNDQGLITAGRDIVEQALKPGSSALYVSPGICMQLKAQASPVSTAVG